MTAYKEILAIMIGGAGGATSRHLLNLYVQRYGSSTFPCGTITVNLIGSLFIGLCGALLEHYKVAAEYRLFILTGFLGSFTTFSTFAQERQNYSAWEMSKPPSSTPFQVTSWVWCWSLPVTCWLKR